MVAPCNASVMPKKPTEPINMPFTTVSWVGPRNRVLDKRARRRHLKNTVERLCAEVMSGSAASDGDAASSGITLMGTFVRHQCRLRRDFDGNRARHATKTFRRRR